MNYLVTYYFDLFSTEVLEVSPGPHFMFSSPFRFIHARQRALPLSLAFPLKTTTVAGCNIQCEAAGGGRMYLYCLSLRQTL